MRSTDPRTIEFPPFVLDLSAGALLRGGTPVALRPKTWEVLCFLARRPGELIAKEELLAALWPGTTVSDGTLGKSVAELRHVLGDDARHPRFIETVQRRGFRFVAGVARDSSVGSPGRRRTESHFVGRVEELAFLAQRLDAVIAAEPRIILVSGEAGAGKSSLLREFVERGQVRSADSAWIVGRGRAIEQRGASEAFLPLLMALDDVVRSPVGADAMAALRRFAPTWLAQLPWLADGATANEVADDGGPRPQRMLREFCAWAEAACRSRAVILELEDLHWSDSATLEVLTMVAQRLVSTRLMIVATLRPPGSPEGDATLAQTIATLRQSPICDELSLTPLRQADVAQYVTLRLGPRDDLTPWVRSVERRSGGLPLFMVALVEDVLQRGGSIDVPKAGGVASPAAGEFPVPERLRQHIQLQLAALAPADREVLAAASIVGQRFGCEETAAAGELSLAAVEEAIERLAQRGMLRPCIDAATRTVAACSSGRPHEFRHALYRQVAYESVAETRRRRMHQRLGEWLEERSNGGPLERAGELAHHFAHGGDLQRSIAYLSEGAAAMQRRVAPLQALDYAERALHLVEPLPASDPLLRQELVLRRIEGWALSTTAGYAAAPARASFERLRELCDRVGSGLDQFAASYSLWHSQAARAEEGLAATSDRMRCLARSLDRPEYVAQAEVLHGRSCFWQGRFAEAQATLTTVADFWGLQPGVGDGVAGLEPPGIAVHFYASATHWLLGMPDRAKASRRHGLAVAASVEDPFILAATWLHASYVSHLWRDVAATERFARRTLQLAEQHDFPFWRGMAQALVGWAQTQRGDAAGAAVSIREGIRQLTAGSVRSLGSHVQAFLAQAYLQLGEFDAGLNAVEIGEALVASSCDQVYTAELARIKGELLWASGRPSAAATCLARARALAREQAALGWELRALLTQTHLETQPQRRVRWRAELADLYGRFGEGLDTPDLQAARSLLSD